MLSYSCSIQHLKKITNRYIRQRNPIRWECSHLIPPNISRKEKKYAHPTEKSNQMGIVKKHGT
jgi:hypothetical protein